MRSASSRTNQERWLVVSNCQTLGFANSLQALAPDVDVVPLFPHRFNRRPFWFNRTFERYDKLFISNGIEAQMPRARLDRIPEHIPLPWFNFRAYHPDLIYVLAGGELLKSPADDYHSGIALAAHRKGISLADARTLFTGRIFEACGLIGWWPFERDRIVAHSAQCGIDISGDIRRWGRNEAFMYSNNHPKIRVLFDIAAHVVRRTGRMPLEAATVPHDNLAYGSGYAVYPEVGESLGVPGAYVFKAYETYRQFGLDEFLAGCFAIYDRYPREALSVPDEFQAVFQQIEAAI